MRKPAKTVWFLNAADGTTKYWNEGSSSFHIGPHFPAPPLWMSRNMPPRTLDGIHGFILDLLERNAISMPRVVAFWRTNYPGENPPHFRGCGMFRVDKDSIQVLKVYSETKGIPGSHGFDDFEWKAGVPEVSWIRLKQTFKDAVDTATQATLPPKEVVGYYEPPVRMLV